MLSRDVLLNPPPRSDVPYYSETGTTSSGSELFLVILLLVVVVVLAGLKVTLPGAAFAVGARRQARSLGLLAATGGNRTQVRRVVLGGGIVLGLAGAVVGVALGLVLAAVARPVLADVAGAEFGRFDVRPSELLAIAALGVVTGVLAAVLPSRSAARQDPVVALTGRRGQVRTPRKVPMIGVLLIVAGVVAAAVGSAMAVAFTTGLNPTNGRSTALVAGLIAGGAAVAQIGLIITSPAIIGLGGRWSGRLPLAGRLALRDAARHRGRSAPGDGRGPDGRDRQHRADALCRVARRARPGGLHALLAGWSRRDVAHHLRLQPGDAGCRPRQWPTPTGSSPPSPASCRRSRRTSSRRPTDSVRPSSSPCGFVELLVAPENQCFRWELRT